jgi:thioredoxin reductase (NADPH)
MKKLSPFTFHELVEVTGTDMPVGVEGIKVKAHKDR